MLKRQPTRRWRGFSSHRPSAPAELPERGPQSHTWPLALALLQVGRGPCLGPFHHHLAHAVCAKHSEGHTSVSPAPCPGLQGREGRKALAGVLAQLRELLAHLPDNHAVHLALGRGFLFGQDAPQGGLQVGEPVAVLQVRRGADHRVHQGQVLHAQLQEEWLSSGTQGRHCHRPWTGTDHVGPRVHGPARSTEDQGHTPSTHPVPGPELASRAAKQMNGWTVLDTGSPRTGPAHRSPGLERRQGQTASSCPSLLCGQRPPNPNRPPHSEDLTHTHSFRY